MALSCYTAAVRHRIVQTGGAPSDAFRNLFCKLQHASAAYQQLLAYKAQLLALVAPRTALF